MNKNERKRSTIVHSGMKKDLSKLSSLIKSINSQNEKESKITKIKYQKSINPRNFSGLISSNLGKLSSSDTLEKKRPNNLKKSKIRNKSISERVVTNYKVETLEEEDENAEKEEDIDEFIGEDEEDTIESSEMSLLDRNIYKKPEINILLLASNSGKKKPKIDIIQNNSNNKTINTKEEYYLSLPNKLKKELNILSIKIIYPIDNKYGKSTKYIQNVAKSIKDFINLDYDSIFSEENSNNVNYLKYEKFLNKSTRKKKLLLLDLDETLVHSELRHSSNYKSLDKLKENSKCYIRSFSYIENDYKYYFDIYFSPYLFDFLHEIKNYFDLAIFTASSKGYADTIINYIDPDNQIFKFRLYREACIPIHQYVYIKDLRIIKNFDEKNIILMDNSFYSFINQPSNGMLIYSFYSNHKDNQLIHAKNFLIKYIYPSKDVRIEIEKWFQFSEFLGKKNGNYSNKKNNDDSFFE